ncbi:MAG: hypothetical protein R3C11_15295 [Planctomycetaceae bacterium]
MGDDDLLNPDEIEALLNQSGGGAAPPPPLPVQPPSHRQLVVAVAM